MSKFENVPVEEDTTIIFSLETKFGDLDVLYQKWLWESVEAESLIFLEEDIKNMTDERLTEEVSSSPLVQQGTEITLKRN